MARRGAAPWLDLPAMTTEPLPTTEFDRQIEVTAAGPGRWLGDLADGWTVGGGVNGGYLLAVIGNAPVS